MSRRSDKCTPEELSAFKKAVLDWLVAEGIPLDGLDVRAFNVYGGDVRIYLGEYMDIPNSRRSFRRTGVIEGGYEGTRGHHITRKAQPVIINRLEWEEFKAAKTTYNSYTDDFNRLVAARAK